MHIDLQSKKTLYLQIAVAVVTFVIAVFLGLFIVNKEKVYAYWCEGSCSPGTCSLGGSKFLVNYNCADTSACQSSNGCYRYYCNCADNPPPPPPGGGCGIGWCGLCWDQCPVDPPPAPPPPPPPPCNCQDPATPVITNPVNGASGLNPDGLVVDWTMGGWGIDTGTQPNCSNSNGNDEFRLFFRRTGGSTADPSPAPAPGTINGSGWNRVDLGRTIRTYTIYNLSGGSTYEIYIRANNGCGTRDSAVRTVTTGFRPDINSLTISSTCAADTTGTFWAGTPGGNSRIYNPANFTSSVTDPNGINDVSYVMLQIDADAGNPENPYRHLKVMFVRSRSGFTNNTFYLWDNNQWKSTITSGVIEGANARVHVGPTGSRVGQSGNNLIVDWNIEFKTSFAQGKHNAYILLADISGAQDRTGGIVTTVNVAPTTPVGDNWHQLANIPNFGVDTASPALTQPVPSIIDANTLDINWAATDSPAGIRKIDGFCWQSGGTDTNITKVSPAPSQTKVLDKADPDPSNNPAIVSNCFASLTASTLMRYDLSQSTGDISAYNFEARAEDYACNILSNTQSQATNSPWLLTYGSNTHTNSMALNIPNSSINQIFVNSTNQPIVNTTGNAFASTYTLSAATLNIPLRGSNNSYINTNYTDLNIDPPQEADTTSYYDYLYSVVTSNVTVKTIAASLFTNKITMSGVEGIAANSTVNYLVQGDLTIQDPTPPRLFTCDTKTILFVQGNLTIDPDFVASGNDNGCIIIVKGNITITNGDYKNTGNTNINSLVRYDRVDAFLITDGTMNTLEDNVGTFKWDGLLIKGSVVANSTLFKRDLRLLNNLSQPGEGIVYDSRYVTSDVFRNAFSVGGFSIREEGFSQ